MACYEAACSSGMENLVFNGDLFTLKEIYHIIARYPKTTGIMLGRGLVAQPGLARELQGGTSLTKAEIIHFHDRLVEEFSKQYQDDIVFMKLRVVMKHLVCCFDQTGRLEK